MPNDTQRGPAGQATVELVTLLPLLAVCLAAGWQLVLAGHAAWAASAAARAAARAHAVGGDEVAAARHAVGGGRDVTVDAADGDARVVVHVRIPAVVPGLDLGSVSSGSTFASQR
jgi:hypothetical protein